VPFAFTCQALVLRTYDTGEADRFCILLTRERGRLAVRASGARRLGSRLGGYLLPFSHLQLGLKEGNSGCYVSSAVPTDPRIPSLARPAVLACAQEGIEVLLSLVSHEEPDPALFDATLRFLVTCGSSASAVALPYIIRLLDILGFLPEQESLRSVMALSEEEEKYVGRARREEDVTSLDRRSRMRVRELCQRLMEDHLSTALRVPSVAAGL